MNKICTNCGEEFEAKRETAKYCSDKCKMAHSRISVTDSKVSVTNKVSVTESVTVKDSVTHPDNDTRSWLIEQFKNEGKQPDEINSIMQAQDTYYSTRSHYFIPARMLALRV